MTPKELRNQADHLHGKRSTLLMQWQDMALNFYPQRADFTYQRTLGMEQVTDLMSSWPLLCARELSDQIGQMLRPTAKQWFESGLANGEKVDTEGLRWLQMADGAMRRAMYDPASQFTRATKEGDNDYATFGQCVITVGLSKKRDSLLYRCHHLRDCVWMEDEDGKLCFFARKWKPTVRDLMRLFPGSVHPDVVLQAQGTNPNPFAEIQCYQIVVAADLFEGEYVYDGAMQGKSKCPWVSLYYDCDNEHVMEAVPQWTKGVIVPRWQTVSGSQYAFSPAAVVALPEARLLQSMTYTLLEAGEKATSPPMIATGDVVRGDVDVRPGGITIVDREYDERLGEALRPITQDLRGMPIGIEMQKDSRSVLSEIFYLNKLSGPPQGGPQKTAFQVGQEVQQYIRDALPLFEPMEMSYNGAIYEETFELSMRNGMFGSPYDMPPSLRGRKLSPTFRSPLHDAIEQQKVQVFLQTAQIIAQAVPMDQSAAMIIDYKEALRDTLEGGGTPAKWMRSVTELDAIAQKTAQDQQAAGMLDQMQKAADVGKTVSEAKAANQQGAPVPMPA